MTGYSKKKFDKIHHRNFYAKDLFEGRVFKPKTIVDKTEERFNRTDYLKKDYDNDEED